MNKQSLFLAFSLLTLIGNSAFAGPSELNKNEKTKSTFENVKAVIKSKKTQAGIWGTIGVGAGIVCYKCKNIINVGTNENNKISNPASINAKRMIDWGDTAIIAGKAGILISCTLFCYACYKTFKNLKRTNLKNESFNNE
ncbi:hypothetical protein KAH94_06625 [bacterium]|nr:hypothetical protein [bacterium]